MPQSAATPCRHPNAPYSPTLDAPVCLQCFAVLPRKRNKYSAVPTIVDTVRFDSQAEARRYLVLKDRERAGEIQGLTVHPQFSLDVAGLHIGLFTLDFGYRETTDGRVVFEDVKSSATRTRDYKLRKRLLKACHGVDVTEVLDA